MDQKPHVKSQKLSEFTILGQIVDSSISASSVHSPSVKKKRNHPFLNALWAFGMVVLFLRSS